MTILFALWIPIYIMPSKGFTDFCQGEYSCVRTPVCNKTHWKTEKGKKKREHILLLSDFCIFTDQSKAFLFNQNLTSTCLRQSVPLCYSFSWEIGSRARDLPVFHIHLSRRHHRVCRLVVFIKRKSLFSVRRGHESQQDFDEPNRLP